MRRHLFMAAIMGLGGCSVAPPVIQAGSDPSDPASQIQTASTPQPRSARPMISGALAEPLPWLDVNRRVGPGRESGR